MKQVELKVARIGNSRGVRIPATTLARYRIGDSVVMEERTEGILLRPRRAASPKLSWEDTVAEMAAQPEDWSDWDATLADERSARHGSARSSAPFQARMRVHSVA